uniref:Uncharacterized protein n=1 Tax=Glossina palpalis gambiensis TaxID=67801 RepID=A0A1B0BI03_9MUSC
MFVNMRADLVFVYGIDFSCLTVLSKYVTLAARSLLKYFATPLKMDSSKEAFAMSRFTRHILKRLFAKLTLYGKGGIWNLNFSRSWVITVVNIRRLSTATFTPTLGQHQQNQIAGRMDMASSGRIFALTSQFNCDYMKKLSGQTYADFTGIPTQSNT